MMLALWIEWIFLRPCLRAYSKANFAMRVDPFSVITLMLSTTPGTTSCSRPTYSPSVFSRTMTRSTPGYFVSRPGRFLNGPEIGEQIELLAQRDVDALEAAADRRRHRPFERHLVALDRLVERRGNVLAVNLERLGAGGEALPLELHAGGLKNAHHRLRNFRPDAVAGNQRNFVRLVSDMISFEPLALASSLSCTRSITATENADRKLTRTEN